VVQNGGQTVTSFGIRVHVVSSDGVKLQSDKSKAKDLVAGDTGRFVVGVVPYGDLANIAQCSLELVRFDDIGVSVKEVLKFSSSIQLPARFQR
jgi:hypothetical protein